jgi:hypothetical protein
MPTVPLYNQGATEEAGLTRAKRRVIKSMNSGIAKLTNKPDEDLSNGSADVLAEKLIARFQDLTVLFRQINAYYGEASEVLELDDSSEILKAIEIVIVGAKSITRFLRVVKAYVRVIRFTDLGILSDVKAAQEECDKEAEKAFDVLASIDFIQIKPDDFKGEPLVELEDDDDDDSLGSFTMDTSSRGSRGSRSLDTTRDGSRSSASSSIRGTVSTMGRRQRRVDNVLEQLQQVMDEMDDTASEMSDVSDISSLTDSQDLAQQQQKVAKQFANFKRLRGETLRGLVVNMYSNYQGGLNILVRGYNNFNMFRQQKVIPAKAADEDVSNAIRTGKGVMSGGFETIQGTASRFYGVTPHIQNIYRVGGSSNILYEREGLPRFL